MIELKNKEGKVITLVKYELINDIFTSGDDRLIVEGDSFEFDCYNTMEDIQAQIRAIKGIVNMTPPERKIVIDYDVSAKNKNEIIDLKDEIKRLKSIAKEMKLNLIKAGFVVSVNI